MSDTPTSDTEAESRSRRTLFQFLDDRRDLMPFSWEIIWVGVGAAAALVDVTAVYAVLGVLMFGGLAFAFGRGFDG